MSEGNPPGPEGTTLEAALRLSAAADSLALRTRSPAYGAGLTNARLSALTFLASTGAATIGRLARAEGVTSPTMTGIVDGLVRLGFAARAPHPDNPRMVRVTATSRGRAVVLTSADRRARRIAHAIDRLPPARRRALLRALDALTDLPSLLEDPGPGAPGPDLED